MTDEYVDREGRGIVSRDTCAHESDEFDRFSISSVSFGSGRIRSNIAGRVGRIARSRDVYRMPKKSLYNRVGRVLYSNICDVWRLYARRLLVLTGSPFSSVNVNFSSVRTDRSRVMENLFLKV